MRDSTFSRFNILSILVLILGGAWIWISAAPPGSTTGGGVPAPRQGFQAPDFTLENADGQTITLSQLRGRPVLINMWASWCTPCRAEMPAMQRIYQDYAGEGFEILAVNTTFQDDPARALAFAQELKLTFPILWDLDGSVSNLYQVRGMPTSFFVDGSGVIQEVIIGGPMAEALLRVRVENLFEGGR
jgi:cytochrome c biogenesis protein CcmG, thiol:disulfide interchange protein DsbE